MAEHATRASKRRRIGGRRPPSAHELARGAGLEQWDAVVEPSVPEGPALLGFVAARIAEEIAGSADAYGAERARQSEWLAERLGLRA
jgi:hypothetical protein